MKRIPKGKVTFLFTDIEGSTKLSQDHPETIQTALDKHHAKMRKAIESNNGFVFEIIGDAFCSAFENANDAVKAAVDAQIDLSNENWDDTIIKVRMGIHSGTADWNDKRYTGYLTLARTSRVMSAAYGEQILISNDAYELAANTRKESSLQSRSSSKESNEYAIAEKISFRDLGERRLKDVIQPIRLFQIITSGLRENFPPLKTLDARPNNLPVQLTSFIGREAEMKQLKDLMRQTHLLTLTGSGGAGKTRLALQIAADVIDEFANGVWFIELASLFEPALLPQVIVKVFGLKEEPKRTLEEVLYDHLKDKEILIVLDNCEHMIEACSKLTERLLNKSPGLKIIATSREALRCEGEQTHRVLSLTLPDPKENVTLRELTQYEAVRLFIERALAVNPGFNINNDNALTLARLCYKLDGIPLAIELAAARVRILSIEKIYEKLNDRFNLLTGGKRTALPRHQTLRSLIDWSYDLLTKKEKLLWRRLSAFAGGWVLEAVVQICSDENLKSEEVLNILDNLTEKSIVIFDVGKERFRMLETIRQYGEEELKKSGELETISNGHLNFYINLAETAEPMLIGPDMQHWLKRLEDESGNFEKALLWTLKLKACEEGVRLAGALGFFWQVRGHLYVGRQWLETVLDNSPDASDAVRAKALNAAGVLAHNQGDYEKAVNLNQESLNIRRKRKDLSGIAQSLNNLGAAMKELCEYDKSREAFEECLAIRRQTGDKHGIAISLNNLGMMVHDQGQHEKARALVEESLAIHREIGDKRSMPLNNLGILEFENGNYIKALNLFEENLAIRREIGDKRGIAITLNNLGSAAFDIGEYERARKLFEESLSIRQETGDQHGISWSLNYLGNVAREMGEYNNARILHEESFAICKDLGDRSGAAVSLENLGSLAQVQGEIQLAEKLHTESLAISHEIGDERGIAVSLNSLGTLMHKQGDYLLAMEHYKNSLTLNQKLGSKIEIAKNISSLIEVFNLTGYHKKAAILFGFIQGVLLTKKVVSYKRIVFNFEKTVLILKKKLGDKDYLKYIEEGKAMTFEQAIETSLRD